MRSGGAYMCFRSDTYIPAFAYLPTDWRKTARYSILIYLYRDLPREGQERGGESVSLSGWLSVSCPTTFLPGETTAGGVLYRTEPVS